MKAGFFTADITMPIGYEMSGGFLKAYSQRIMGPLKIRAAFFSDGKINTAFAVVDSSNIDKTLISLALAEAKERCGISFDAYIISASHVHTGGYLRQSPVEKLRSVLDAELFAKMETSSLPAPVECYHKMVVSHLASALCEAYYRMEEASLSTGKGSESGRVFNRRLRLKDGRDYTHPGKMNPEIAGFAGPIDPEVNVLAAWRPDGSMIGCLINYGCHGTTMCGTKGSHGDWFQYTEEVIKKLMGENTGVVILNGPCGDVTQVNNLSPEHDYGERVARELGGRVAAEAYKVLLSARPVKDCSMSFAREVLRAPKRRPSQQHFQEAVKKLKSSPPSDSEESIFARTTIMAEALYRLNPENELDITAIQIGDAVIVSCQAELFCQLGLDIKAGSHFPFTFICSLANGESTYVPTLEAFDPVTGGGYETRLTPGRMNIDTGNKIVERSVALVNTLQPDPPEQISFTPRTTWSYGANRPEID